MILKIGVGIARQGCRHAAELACSGGRRPHTKPLAQVQRKVRREALLEHFGMWLCFLAQPLASL